MQVALAEDGALFREGLLMLLKAAGHEVVACAASGDELVRRCCQELMCERVVQVADDSQASI